MFEIGNLLATAITNHCQSVLYDEYNLFLCVGCKVEKLWFTLRLKQSNKVLLNFMANLKGNRVLLIFLGHYLAKLHLFTL